jgi:hypothetical protein
MRFTEYQQPLAKFRAQIRVANDHGSVVVSTSCEAGSLAQARAMLVRLFGVGNLVALVQDIAESGPKPPSPGDLQVKSMSDQAQRLQQQAKQAKARNKLAKAQQQLVKATSQRANH